MESDNVEYLIGYGTRRTDKDGNINYVFDDVEVGVSDTGRVHHVKYTHKKNTP